MSRNQHTIAVSRASAVRLRALANHQDIPITRLIDRWIDQAYASPDAPSQNDFESLIDETPEGRSVVYNFASGTIFKIPMQNALSVAQAIREVAYGRKSVVFDMDANVLIARRGTGLALEQGDQKELCSALRACRIATDIEEAAT
ncbi:MULTISPECIES: hypothetical protein [unclassified Beijerinckia]|uniref:hypothetical protein n=1 Tax=unclassified Beijerinckia TaxID=2638183 RepID=UPI00089A0F56|nr:MULTISPECIES: hypothetical protein [unclassified Beijerinckia]MDH7795804.1 high-affinity K+ transport system ATPase subunit B [Beijerinckia sp. GAS462]SEC17093.1 hypothetical protein SAMN05443249_2082 [Beijerinckia sp. 28-YEA-48]